MSRTHDKEPTVHKRLPRALRALAVTSVASVVATLLSAAPAFAHVTVHPATMAAGSSDIELTFRVPDERDNADTVGLQVYFPTNLPLVTVNVLPVPGWTAKVDTRTLTTPIQAADGPVDQVVTDITWTATAGGIVPGQYQDFAISAGQAPLRVGSVVFKALQTYSSGEIVRWIQVAGPQNPTPDAPAPVLTLTGPTPATAAASPAGSSSAEVLAIAALAVAIAALLGVLVILGGARRTPKEPAGAPGESAGEPPT